MTGPTATAGIFATYLPEYMTLWRGFLDEVSGSVWVPLLKSSPPKEALTTERTRTLGGVSASGLWLGALLKLCGLARGPG